MTQLADAVERAPRADGVLGTRESERGVQRLADGGVRLGGDALCADPRGQLVFVLSAIAFGADGDDGLGQRKDLADHALPVLIGEHAYMGGGYCDFKLKLGAEPLPCRPAVLTQANDYR